MSRSPVEKQREYNRRYRAKRTPEQRAAFVKKQAAWKRADPYYHEKRTRGLMIERCDRPANKRFHRYGGRGITVCERWRESFENFLADMGRRPPGTTIDRIDNDGNYEPGNCRWATRREQRLNSSQNHFLSFRGETLPLCVWAERLGLPTYVIRARLNRLGWSVEDALTQPTRKVIRGR